ncbi:MAG: hypothetical protein V7603_5132 [Micromonosporaceae bacterium]
MTASSAAAAALSVVHDVAPVVAAGGFTLLGVRLAQRNAERQQTRAGRAAANEKIETVTGELLTAVFDLRTALATHQPRWNAWEPRLMTVGLSFLEFAAGHSTGGFAHGVVQAGRVVRDWHNDSYAAALSLLGAPYSRLTAALSRAALLPNPEVVAAALQVGEAATAAMSAYGADALYRVKAATAERAAADVALEDAAGTLMRTVRDHLRPPTPAAGRLASLFTGLSRAWGT